MSLHERSIEIILKHQADSGAYLASPDFPTYQYSWFRDGAYIAYAMDLVGEHDSAHRFHQWVASTLNSRAETVRTTLAKVANGLPLEGQDFLHTRYTAAGNESPDGDWPNHQLDGFGTWLWAVGEHIDRTSEVLATDWREASDLVAAYLTALWPTPCFDCWEEHPSEVHTYTLATIFGGLKAHQRLTGTDHAPTMASISTFLQHKARNNGHFVKYAGSTVVDASLLGLAVPYGVVRPTGAAMLATVARIESTLRRGGGLHRYPDDTYYGGGEWLLLTSWLVWFYRSIGRDGQAERANEWVRSQATADGFLPEQVPENLNDPDFFEPWRERWGNIATPLLWSHAMYLISETAPEQPQRDVSS